MNYIKFDLNGYIVDKNIQGIVATSNDADVIHIFYANDTSTEETAYRTRARLKRADGHTIGPIILTLSTASFDTQAEAETFGLAVYNIETEKWDVACRKLSLTAEMLGVKGDIGISIIYDQVNESGAVLSTDVNQMIVAKVYEAVDEMLTEEESNQLIEFFLPRDLGDLTDGNKPDLTQKIVIRQGGETKLITLDQLNSLLEDGVTEFKKVKYDINSPAETLEIGETRWNVAEGTYETRLSAYTYLLHSQEVLFKCFNTSGVDIPKGTAVYISGASPVSSNIFIYKADNTNITNTSRMIGLATEDIDDNSRGYVCFSGVVKGINTTSFNVGDMLYLSNSGTLTNVRPTGLVVEIGIVIRKHSTGGTVVISPRYYPRLDDLSNVNFTNSAEGDVAVRLANGTYTNYNLLDIIEQTSAKDSEQDGRLTTNESNIANLEDGTTVIPTYELKANKNVANGYVGLDTNVKIPLVYLYDVVLGQLEYAGSFNPNSGYPTQTNALDPNRNIRKGDYFIANANGTISGVEYHTGDWAVRGASDWQKIDNTDAVASVNGKIGIVNLTGADINVSGADTTTIADKITAIMTAINDRYTKSEVYTKTEMNNIIEQLKSLYDLEESVLYNGELDAINVDYANITGTNFVIMEVETDYSTDAGVTFKKQLDTFTITTDTLTETGYNQLFSLYNKDSPSEAYFWFELYNNSGYLEFNNGGGVSDIVNVNIKLTAYKMKPLNAENMSYDNSLSGLDAENVQEAIDEIENEIDSVETDITNITNGTTDITFSDEDLTATNLADAISEVNDRVDATNTNLTNEINQVNASIEETNFKVRTNELKTTQLEESIRKVEAGDTKGTVSDTEVINLPLNTASGQLKPTINGMTLQAEQLIENGNFESNTGWLGGGSYYTYDTGQFKLLANAELSTYQSFQKVSIPTGDKVYIAYKYIITSYTQGNINTQIADYNDIALLENNIQQTVSPTYVFYSTMVTSTNGGIQINLRGEDTPILKAYWDYVFAFDYSKLITNKQYSPLYQTTFDLMTNEQIKEQMDLWMQDETLLNDNVQSVNGNKRVKSVGKNLFDLNASIVEQFGNSTKTIISNGLQINATPNGGVSYVSIPYVLKPLTIYRIQAVIDGNNNPRISVRDTTCEGIASFDETGSVTFTTDNNGTGFFYFYANHQIETGVFTSNYTNIQLELGSTATTYETYKSTEMYINAPKLYSLPNGVKDTIEFRNGKYYYVSRVKKYVLQAGDIVYLTAINELDNVDEVRVEMPSDALNGLASVVEGKVYIPNSFEIIFQDRDLIASIGGFCHGETMRIRFVLAKGTYATLAEAQSDLAGTEIYYQLATPLETEVLASGNLLGHSNGTVYIENIVADVDVYTTKIDITNTDLPIKRLEKIAILNENGTETLLNVATAVINVDKLSFTHPDLTANDKVYFIYEYEGSNNVFGTTNIEYFNSNNVIIDSVTSKAYRIVNSVSEGTLTQTLEEVL